MREFTLTHEINCDAETFWKVFLDGDFTKAVYLEGLQFPSYEQLELRESDTEVVRRLRVQPRLNAPKAVQKLLGDRFTYEEEGRFDRESKTWTWKTIPSALKGKLNSGGSLRIEPAGDKRCRRVAEMKLEAKVFGIGSMVEGHFEKELRAGWDNSATFMNQWLEEHPPG